MKVKLQDFLLGVWVTLFGVALYHHSGDAVAALFVVFIFLMAGRDYDNQI